MREGGELGGQNDARRYGFLHSDEAMPSHNNQWLSNHNVVQFSVSRLYSHTCYVWVALGHSSCVGVRDGYL